MIFLSILGGLWLYAIIAGLIGAKHHSIQRARYQHEKDYCFHGIWCLHATVSFWLGVGWILTLPATLGIMLGNASRGSRVEARRQREMDEAQHRLQIAKVRAEETEALERALKPID